MFGDRINIVVDDYEKEFPKIETLLNSNGIDVADSRAVTPSLENVFMHLIKEAS